MLLQKNEVWYYNKLPYMRNIVSSSQHFFINIHLQSFFGVLLLATYKDQYDKSLSSKPVSFYAK